MDEHRMTATMDSTAPALAPEMIDTPIEAGPIRATRFRVAKVLKRLRRKTPSNAAKQNKQLPTPGSESFFHLDEEQFVTKSNISEITDIVYGDDSWSDDGEDNKNPKTFRPPSPQFSHSSVPSIQRTNVSNSTDPSLSQSLETWLDSLSYLAQSKEMRSFLHSSNSLAQSAASKSLETARTVGEIAVHTALLPVTLPLHVTASATGIVFNQGSNALHYFCDNLVPIVVKHSIRIPKNRLLATNSDTHNRFQDGSESTTETETSVPRKAKSTINNQLETGPFCYHHDEFLDRLRLDSHLITRMDHKNDIDDASQAVLSIETDSLTIKLNASMASSPDYSKYILRVDDINVNFKENPDSDSQMRVVCVDLDKDYSDEGLNSDALAQLAQRCIDIALSNEFVLSMLPDQTQEQSGAVNTIDVNWKPLGQTKKDYNRLKKLTKNEYYDELCDRVCIWTGKYLGEKYHGSENPFFMAQGVVGGSPIEIYDLLWDSKRCNEYNKHCVDREDIFSIDDDEETTTRAFCGAKIIYSETKIPFTSMSVKLTAVMCAELLGDRPEDGFIIFSRSLNHGPTGYHSSKTEGLCETSKNEVVLGINIMRPVPGRPELTDLISISQVDASILPPFLKSRVGTMAVEDFFKNVRVAFQCSQHDN